MTDAVQGICTLSSGWIGEKAKRIISPARLEAILMILIGVGACWFAVGEDYERLMNPRFRWLTIFGAVLVFTMGTFAFVDARKTGFSGSVVLMLLWGVVLLGKPFSGSDATALVSPPLAPAKQIIEDPKYPLMEIKDVQTGIEEKEGVLDGMAFSAVGMVKLLPSTEGNREIALMRSYMVCCAADALAMGFRLRGSGVDKCRDGEWLVVSGTLLELPEPEPVPPFRMGTASFPTVNDRYVIKPVRIVDHTATFPPLADQLSSKKITRFKQALQTTGLMEVIGSEGPFTIFAPINAAFEGSGFDALDKPLNPEQAARLKEWLSWHIVQGRLLTGDLFKKKSLTTLHNKVLDVQVENGKIRMEGSRLLFKNTIACNGILHFIYPGLKKTP
jgi:uncharacterized surface protein with fasciclin (FAS1) repeats